MTILVRAPAQTEALLCVTKELHLRVDMARGYAWMFRPIPYHHSTIRAHGRDDVRVLRLVSCFVDFALVIYFLHNVELDFYGHLLRRPSTVSPNLLTLLVILGDVWGNRVRQLTVDDLQVVLSLI